MQIRRPALPPCCFTFKYCTFCDRVSNVTTNNFVLRLNWSFGEILCSTKPVKMKIFSCNYQKKSLIDMEHDFVLKYQTSKISNIKTKTSNNIQTLYLNKTINTMTVFTWILKFLVTVAWICPVIVLEHIIRREFNKEQWANALFLIRCICNKKMIGL